MPSPFGRNQAFAFLHTFWSLFRAYMCKTENMKTDWKLVSRQLISALRGRLSRAHFSRLLGYTTNVVSDWEAGRRSPTMGEFLRACSVRKWDVLGAVESFHRAASPSFCSCGAYLPSRWLDELRGSTSVVEIARRANISRFQAARWLSGESQPRIGDFLKLLDAITGRAADFIGRLVGAKKIPALQALLLRQQAARRLAFAHPASEGVLRILETERYQNAKAHRAGMIADALGLPLEQEEMTLHALLEAGIVRRAGTKYSVGEPLAVETNASIAEKARLKGFWMDVAKRRLEAPQESDFLGYLVVSLSEHDRDQARAILARTYREILSLVASSEPVETAALVQLSLVNFES